ncbi:hypothetical protein BOTCAL_0057g00340 [Botryotinia calthae]|uniref:Uncharacterized protein n=1 Tax=Botryotinia calthae TaxID=38488 RepID=A0A4Y8DCM2_9HELO|nr:hypothetical protein BOTCAL_0057g00340 [Botryotinia calthae]
MAPVKEPDKGTEEIGEVKIDIETSACKARQFEQIGDKNIKFKAYNHDGTASDQQKKKREKYPFAGTVCLEANYFGGPAHQCSSYRSKGHVRPASGSLKRQIEQDIAGPMATPGRMLHLMRHNRVTFTKLKTLVLDEANALVGQEADWSERTAQGGIIEVVAPTRSSEHTDAGKRWLNTSYKRATSASEVDLLDAKAAHESQQVTVDEVEGGDEI